MQDRETIDAITEINTRIEALEQYIDKLSDNFLKLESVLTSIAGHILPPEEFEDINKDIESQ